MTRLIYVHLCGGLGNQLFQYATALALAKQRGAELVVDAQTGFASDRQFRRTFALEGLVDLCYRRATWLERLPFRCLPILQKFQLRYVHFKCFVFSALNMPNPQFIQFKLGRWCIFSERLPLQVNLRQFPAVSRLWLYGYWQSPQVFSQLRRELWFGFEQAVRPSKRLERLGKIILGRPTLALGIRLYEETPHPELNAYKGKIKSMLELKKALDSFLLDHPDVQVAVFCTHRNPSFEQLSLPGDTLFLTGDDGIVSASETLWLISRCRHHLFLNSSLYWWGAWLSAEHYSESADPQIVIAADNFINQACCLPTWKSF